MYFITVSTLSISYQNKDVNGANERLFLKDANKPYNSEQEFKSQ